MKHIVFLFSLLVSSVVLYGAGQYEVYQCQGSVACKSGNTGQWQAVVLHQSINATDSLQIPQNGSVGILHTSTGQVFHSVNSGTIKVYDMIKQARQQSSNTLALINQQMKQQMQGSGSTTTYAYVGATTRSVEGEDAMYEDTLTLGLRQLASEILWGKMRCKSNTVEARRVAVGEECFYTILNRSEVPLYVNILQVDVQHQKMGLLYRDLPMDYPFLLVLPNQEICLDMYRFLPNSERVNVVFATERAYDANLLQELIRYEAIKESTENTALIWCAEIR